MPTFTFPELDADGLRQHIDRLSEVLVACVEHNAPLGFTLPFTPQEARTFWRGSVAPSLADGRRRLWIAQQDGTAVGAVQLTRDVPSNQRHRAEISKLMVHPNARRHGVARNLLGLAIQAARDTGLSLLTLDTETDSPAEQLYLGFGFERAGIIPGFATPPRGGPPKATTLMFRPL